VMHPNSENRKKNSKEGSMSGSHLSDPFEQWWLLYPKRVSKGAARKAYAKVIKAKLATVEELKAGVLRYGRERTGLDSEFTKHPATWLNQECWKDEPPKPGGIIGAGDFNGGGFNGAVARLGEERQENASKRTSGGSNGYAAIVRRLK
jgi:hypothetical protein